MSDSSTILTVSRLTELLKEVVEENFLEVAVEGEISNFAAPGSGHFYFVLKDENSQIRCVMFRPFSRLMKFVPENGMQVICKGRMSLYSQRGELQLMVEALEVSGVGTLQEAFFRLKERLAEEGLFAEEHKSSLPTLPGTIGVVTSPTGAAIRDVVQVLSRRAAGVRILLRPVKVQGEGAAQEISEAIADFNDHGEADVLIVCRGGGSLEDLWAFNEEVVARAIFASSIPVISAVGHEVDFTISDFAADMRAPTPSAAAEMVMKSRLEYESHMDHLAIRLAGKVRSIFQFYRERLESLRGKLRSPQEKLAWQSQRCDDLFRRLNLGIDRFIQTDKARLAAVSGRLDSLSPVRTMARGYSIVRKDEVVIRRADELVAGDLLKINFSEGAAEAVVRDILSGSNTGRRTGAGK
jgi:exodeoxyribonuclease VII large subunit